MSRYIDAEKLVEKIKASPVFPNMGEDGYFLRGCVCDLIERQPTVDAKKVNHGKFILYGMFGDLAECSVCGARGYTAEYAIGFDYCPNCGAKMDGEESEA